MTDPEEITAQPDLIDILIGEMGSEARARALIKRLNDNHLAIVAVGQEALEKCVMTLSAMFEGIPAAAVMAALADQGVYVVARPEVRHDWVSLADNTLLATHPRDRCDGRHCCIHNPSDHALKAAPMEWNDRMGRTERICDHGQHHPDPDHLTYVLDHEGMLAYFQHKYHHPCDGCCKLPDSLLNLIH